MFFKKKIEKKFYDKDTQKPVIKASICNGEQFAGFQDIHTGSFEEVMLISNENDQGNSSYINEMQYGGRVDEDKRFLYFCIRNENLSGMAGWNNDRYREWTIRNIHKWSR